jgi:hypothetical protein
MEKKPLSIPSLEGISPPPLKLWDPLRKEIDRNRIEPAPSGLDLSLSPAAARAAEGSDGD